MLLLLLYHYQPLIGLIGIFVRMTLASSVTEENVYHKQIQWTRADLTYAVVGSAASKNQTSQEAVERTVREAFSEWERNSCFRFRRSDYQFADIKVAFTNDKPLSLQLKSQSVFYHRNCTRKFRRNVAHAFFLNNRRFPAHIHINNEIFWLESRPIQGSISLKSIVLHEIGHVLGLFHSDDPSSVMYDYVYTNQVKRVARVDRVELQRMYQAVCGARKYSNRRVSLLKATKANKKIARPQN